MEEDYTSFALKALAFVGPQQRCSPPPLDPRSKLVKGVIATQNAFLPALGTFSRHAF
jgi:hypothetical protein